MKRGKKICKTLKGVRMMVAKANDIDYSPTECHYEGECSGTCPKCESEVRWLEQQLQLHRQLGKAVAVVGVSMGLAALAACHGKASNQTAGEVDIIPDTLLEASHTVAPDVAGLRDTFPVLGRVDLMASFPGGLKALYDFLQKNIEYPEQAEKDSISGQVVVSFVVETDGSITNAKVVKSAHPLLDAEALRVVGIMPKWEPGEQADGTKVRNTYNLPITFMFE